MTHTHIYTATQPDEIGATPGPLGGFWRRQLGDTETPIPRLTGEERPGKRRKTDRSKRQGGSKRPGASQEQQEQQERNKRSRQAEHRPQASQDAEGEVIAPGRVGRTGVG